VGANSTTALSLGTTAYPPVGNAEAAGIGGEGDGGVHGAAMVRAPAPDGEDGGHPAAPIRCAPCACSSAEPSPQPKSRGFRSRSGPSRMSG
jgi:hypothetical protein